MKNKLIVVSMILLLNSLSACNKYLDIIPDNVATIDMAFRLRSTAERFLFTCYSYMPEHAVIDGNPAFLAGDELWQNTLSDRPGLQIARGLQNVSTPYINYWGGTGSGVKDLYEGIRQCNIFLENISLVPDMVESEKKRWIAEVKFLKAYYHFWLVRMYGPIVLVKENIPVSAGPDEVRMPRSPVDSCFSYIEKLLNESETDIVDRIDNDITELGRIDKAIVLSLKAKVLVTAASPLFNGNPDYQGFANKDGTLLFNPTPDPGKWQKAVDACKEAVDFCESRGHRLYRYIPQFSQFDLSDTTLTKMSIRNAVTEKWNSEIIWANTNSMADDIQYIATQRGLDPRLVGNTNLNGNLAPPLKIAEMFYTSNGVPITEAKVENWSYEDRFKLQVAGENDRYNLKKGYTTAKLNFGREPRFYANLGFDGGIWYGQGHYDDNGTDLLFLAAKKGQSAWPGNYLPQRANATGYWAKKLVNFQNIIGEVTGYTIQTYPWPVVRLADLYLLYAEALNEVNGPGSDVYKYVNLVRERAGIPSVEESWTNYSKSPDKHTTKIGMRQIIHQERLIELAFEGHRFWDLRRWKEAVKELNKPITGWAVDQETPEGYYRERLIYNQTFLIRDYFWPLNETAILKNNNLVQTYGW